MSTANSIYEQILLDGLQAECNTVYQQCQLPADRAATDAEMRTFFAGLQRLEDYCASRQTAAANLASNGHPALSQRLAAVMHDICTARDVFKQPSSAQPGPATQRALDLQQQQRDLDEFSTNAMRTVATDPARAEPLLAEALERAARMFLAQKEFLQTMPWGAEQLSRLERDRIEAITILHMGVGQAATILGKYPEARTSYQTALAILGPAQHPARPYIQEALAQIGMLEAGRVRK